MKKLLLGLGTLSIAILPVAALVSCGDTTSTTDLGITTTEVTQEIITAAAEVINQKAPATEAEIIIALQTVFTGITADNYKNFVTTATIDVITLKANSGFAFGETTENEEPVTTLISIATSLETELSKFNDPIITKTLDAKASLAADSINNETTPETKSIALAKFAIMPTPAKGFTYEVESASVDTRVITSVNVKVTITEIAGTVGLNTKEAILIVIKLKEDTDYAITAIPVEQIKLDTAALAYQQATSDDEKLLILKDIFTGLDLAKIKNIEVRAHSNPTEFILMAKIGFTINKSNQITSKVI